MKNKSINLKEKKVGSVGVWEGGKQKYICIYNFDIKNFLKINKLSSSEKY